jgi:acyl phosphate:glycerol-3-phosphate acyltransferase
MNFSSITPYHPHILFLSQAASTLLIGYFIGAIPFAVIVGRMFGVDVLTQGSKNPGATNVKRLAGATAGNIVFLLDFTKGLVATGLPLLGLIPLLHPTSLAIAGLVGAILGHSFSVFIGFRGGKGVATSMGGLMAIMPFAVLIGLICWLIFFYTTHYVSLASIAFAVSLPISAFGFQLGFSQLLLALAITVFIVVKHQSNIRRLIKGEEHKFVKK